MKFNKEEFSNLIQSARLTKNLSWYKKVILPKILENKYRYQEVADKIGCPLAMVPLIHLRERASDLGKFKAYLGNGQPLTQVTTIVPKGRGPFQTWVAGATDAFALQSLDKVEQWSLERMLYELERYNGFGYRSKGINTPYVWNGTNLYSKGRYVSDGKYSSTSVDGNIGCYALYLMLVEADPSFKVNLEVPTDKEPVIEEPSKNWLSIILDLLKQIFGIISEHNSPKTEEETPINEPVEKPKLPDTTGGLLSNRNRSVLLKAAGELGVKEIRGSGSNKQVEEYLDYGYVNNKSSLSDSTPWCAGFIAWVLEKVGMGSTNSLMARSYERWGVSTKSNPMPGDIATRYRGVKSKGFGHVNFFLGWHNQGRSYYGLGGNQNDEVNVSIYSIDKLTDIRRSSKQKPFTAEEIADLKLIADNIIKGKPVLEGGKVT